MINSDVRESETEKKTGKLIVEYPKAKIVNPYMKNKDMVQISNFATVFLIEVTVIIGSK